MDQMRAVRSAEPEATYWPPGHAAVSHTGNKCPRKVTKFAASSVLHSLTVLLQGASRAVSLRHLSVARVSSMLRVPRAPAQLIS